MASDANCSKQTAVLNFWPEIRAHLKRPNVAVQIPCLQCFGNLNIQKTVPVDDSDDFEHACILPCGHVTGSNCLRGWVEECFRRSQDNPDHLWGHAIPASNLSCPLCRHPLACGSCGNLFSTVIAPSWEDPLSVDDVPPTRPEQQQSRGDDGGQPNQGWCTHCRALHRSMDWIHTHKLPNDALVYKALLHHAVWMLENTLDNPASHEIERIVRVYLQGEQQKIQARRWIEENIAKWREFLSEELRADWYSLPDKSSLGLGWRAAITAAVMKPWTEVPSAKKHQV